MECTWSQPPARSSVSRMGTRTGQWTSRSIERYSGKTCFRCAARISAKIQIWPQPSLRWEHNESNHHLDTIFANAEYHFGNRLSGTLGWFDTGGTVNPLLYAQSPVTGSANGNPRGAGYIANFSYWPMQNIAAWRPIYRIYPFQRRRN